MACEGVRDEVKKEMLEIHTNLQEINEEGCVGVGEKTSGNDEVVVRSSKDGFKRRRVGSEASVVDEKNEKTSREEACQAIARFFYNNAIPFAAAQSDEFKTMFDLVSRQGEGFKPPSYDEIRGKYLTDEVKLTNEALEEHRAMWKVTGCTIMVDGSVDAESRTIINLLVNSPNGTFFLKSIDATDMLESPDKLFRILDNIVEEVGEENVVQIVTDNTPFCRAVGEMLMEKRTRLYWTPCATNCIQMILADCETNIPIHSEITKKCQDLIAFIYVSPSVKSLMRHFTKGKDILKVGMYQSETSYFTLCCIHENKGALVRMFTSEEWKSTSNEFAEPKSRKWAEDMILDKEFWKYVMICYKGVKPLLNLLLMVNSTVVPMMGFIYEDMERAKDKIRRSLSKSAIERESFMHLQKIIDERWDKQFHSPLHAAGYFLNAQYHYSPGFRDDVKVKRGLQHCITRMVTDHEERSKIEIQLDDFDKQANQFGHPIAIITADMEIPPIWWGSLVDGPPELQKFAIRVLSLTCSCYGGFPLQDAFEMVHSKSMMYRTDRDVLFVMANSKLAEKKRTSAELNIDDNGDVEGLNVDDSDLDVPCLQCQADAGIADLHDENANGDEDEDGNEDEDEDEDGDEN
ncbi:putative ribonuclease H-like domain-containing protein [Medicago truncatula]|uniref:Putative ribonuclease H-like domain-containing protein n=1 Tax=Medicago truncatula TaxID=3880 RepID=A0A396HA24_MEDTR|nr:uncharacterized protein LOC112422512 [Medicago truncatula]RHN50129.1 putative ribonuclease H-like domain-containing protein [Medicago truncatula]